MSLSEGGVSLARPIYCCSAGFLGRFTHTELSIVVSFSLLYAQSTDHR